MLESSMNYVTRACAAIASGDYHTFERILHEADEDPAAYGNRLLQCAVLYKKTECVALLIRLPRVLQQLAENFLSVMANLSNSHQCFLKEMLAKEVKEGRWDIIEFLQTYGYREMAEAISENATENVTAPFSRKRKFDNNDDSFAPNAIPVKKAQANFF